MPPPACTLWVWGGGAGCMGWQCSDTMLLMWAHAASRGQGCAACAACCLPACPHPCPPCVHWHAASLPPLPCRRAARHQPPAHHAGRRRIHAAAPAQGVPGRLVQAQRMRGAVPVGCRLMSARGRGEEGQQQPQRPGPACSRPGSVVNHANLALCAPVLVLASPDPQGAVQMSECTQRRSVCGCRMAPALQGGMVSPPGGVGLFAPLSICAAGRSTTRQTCRSAVSSVHSCPGAHWRIASVTSCACHVSAGPTPAPARAQLRCPSHRRSHGAQSLCSSLLTPTNLVGLLGPAQCLTWPRRPPHTS